MKTNSILFLSVLSLLLFFACQNTTTHKIEGNPSADFKGKISRSYKDSKEWWPTPTKAPDNAPNVIIFLLDDTGFGQLGAYGGLIETPNIDRLAANGLRYKGYE